MGDQNQSEGRNQNGATPTDQWQSKGVSGDKTSQSDAQASNPTTQPYGAQSDADEQAEEDERTGRTAQVTGEHRSFQSASDADTSNPPGPHDFTGPAGDPSEGKRSDAATGR